MISWLLLEEFSSEYFSSQASSQLGNSSYCIPAGIASFRPPLCILSFLIPVGMQLWWTWSQILWCTLYRPIGFSIIIQNFVIAPESISLHSPRNTGRFPDHRRALLVKEIIYDEVSNWPLRITTFDSDKPSKSPATLRHLNKHPYPEFNRHNWVLFEPILTNNRGLVH